MKRLALVAMLLASPAMAADDGTNHPAFITGMGSKHCSEYVSAPIDVKLHYLTYATGFISAFNLFNRIDKQYMRQPTELAPILDKACGANPDAEFWEILRAWTMNMT